jgi:transposase
MSTKTRSKRGRSGRGSVQKANGVLHPRVQKVGPQRFGIVCVDVGKAKSEWMLCDFYGKVLIEPTEVLHTRSGFDLAILKLRETLRKYRIRDQVVAVERTGNYHLPVKRAFAAAGFETRIVHPFATKQFRQPADPGNKTDPNDLDAMFRATVTGFGLVEQELDDVSRRLRLLARHRRDLVEKRSSLCCQIREHLDALLPGYAALFDDLWGSAIAIHVARHFPSPEMIREAGVEGLKHRLRDADIRVHQGVLQRMVTWASNAALPADATDIHRRIWTTLDDDRAAKALEIQALERDIASLVVQTPYVLLLSHPGVNVVTAGELAAEMGPITHYPNAKAITGRAGLFPSRYQSVDVDLADGKIIRCRNRRLRTILIRIADNLVQCNHHFRGLNAIWKSQGKDPRWSRVKVACRFTRILYQIVAGQQVFRHPSQRGRAYILDKLVAFHRHHATSLDKTLIDLNAAIRQIPKAEYHNEAAPLQTHYERTQNRHRRQPQPIGDILLVVLARLGVGTVQSTSEDRDPS